MAAPQNRSAWCLLIQVGDARSPPALYGAGIKRPMNVMPLPESTVPPYGLSHVTVSPGSKRMPSRCVR
jgi:hypothetical protein